MSRSSEWLDDNSEYLSCAIALLRLRVEGYAAADGIPPGEQEQRTGKQQTAKRTKSSPFGEVLEKAAKDLAGQAEKMVSPPAFVTLGEAFGLSEFERNVLLLCAAAEFDSSIQHLCAAASQALLGNVTGDGSPTFALALSIFDNPAWDALSPERPLRYWRLVEINHQGAQSLISSGLRTDERIVDFIKGLNRPDDRLRPYLTRIDMTSEEASLPPSQQSVVKLVVRRWDSEIALPHPVIQLAGSSYESKQMIALAISKGLGCQLYRIAADSLPTPVAEIELLSRLWERECILLPVALLVDAQNVDCPSEAYISATRRFITRGTGFVFLRRGRVGQT